MVGSDSMVDSLVGSESEAGFGSAVGPGSTLSVGSILGMQAHSDSAHSLTEEYFLPAILQSTEGSFQHYDRWLHSMCTTHEGTPSDKTGLTHNLVLLLDL